MLKYFSNLTMRCSGWSFLLTAYSCPQLIIVIKENRTHLCEIFRISIEEWIVIIKKQPIRIRYQVANWLLLNSGSDNALTSYFEIKVCDAVRSAKVSGPRTERRLPESRPRRNSSAVHFSSSLLVLYAGVPYIFIKLYCLKFPPFCISL